MSSCSSNHEVCICTSETPNDAGYAVLNTLSVLFSAGITGFNLYQLFKFFQLRDEPVIKQRYAGITMTIVFLSLPLTIIFIPMASDFYSFECIFNRAVLRSAITYEHEMESVASQGLEAFIILSFLIFAFAWAFSIVTRVWLLRYEYERNRATAGKNWKMILGMEGGVADWYVKHRQSYGNWKYVSRMLTIPYVIVVFIFILTLPVMGYMDGDWEVLLAFVSLFSLITLGFIVLNVWKIRNIHDNFQIRREILLMSKWCMGLAVWQIVVFLIGRSLPSKMYHWMSFLFCLFAQFLFTAVNYFQTGWVLREIVRTRKQSTRFLIDNLDSDWENNVTLETIVGQQDGFEVFMEFLVAEFSTENLLCYVECSFFLQKWKYELRRSIRQRAIENAADDVGAGSSSLAAVATAAVEVTVEIAPTTDKPAVTHSYSGKPLLSAGELVEQTKKGLSKVVHKAADVVLTPAASPEPEFVQTRSQRAETESLMLDPDCNSLFTASHNNPMLPLTFLSESQALKDKLSCWEHLSYLRNQYIRSSSQYQVNIRASLYRSYTSIHKDECVLTAIDEELIPKLTLSISANMASVSIPEQAGSDRDLITDLPSASSPQSASSAKVSNAKRLSGIGLTAIGPTSRRKRHAKGILKVLQIVEDTRSDLWKLMQDSYLRFRGTKQYVTLVTALYEKQQKKERMAAAHARKNSETGKSEK